MSKVKFKLNTQGVSDLMKSANMKAILQEMASDIQYRCGDGYAVAVSTHKKRAKATVSAATQTAKRDNLKNNTLLKAVR
ncbi:hypothetical protein KG090_00605 [Carnobacteriaceae bacterium zg-ZUI240]|nr:hypothetical protein [Carnobacteriaceae bacterium zg-ZUI240]